MHFMTLVSRQNADVLVLGAGIIGVCVALHLQKLGRSVVLVDRRAPGEETSYGNAGLIERASVIPYGFPRDLPTVLRYAFNTSTDVRFHWSFLPRILPWLGRFWFESSAARLRQAALDMLPLIENSVSEHEALMREAGATDLVRHRGWIEAYRTGRAYERAARHAGDLREFGLRYECLDAGGLGKREPHLSNAFTGAVHWLDPATVVDPGRMVKEYAALFVRDGGRLVEADAASLAEEPSGWSLKSAEASFHAGEAVVALGPWSDIVYRRLGYKVPLAIKRGYHVHFNAAPDAVLNHSIVDSERGYLLAPMAKGIRLTTGIEFAPRDGAATPVQLDRTEPYAREVFPLGMRIEDRPWMGARPCLPDMRPVIGPATRHKGLWFAFGHNHHGLTLGPVTGRLLAEMMTGAPTFADPRPFRIDRFR
jgi:D-amino-acid dehydrogenase